LHGGDGAARARRQALPPGAAARRTLITLDRDYLDDRRFPPAESGGVFVINAPDERLLASLLQRIDRAFFRQGDDACEGHSTALPLAGRKMQVHTDWGRSTEKISI
jgi:hypothetical protein